MRKCGLVGMGKISRPHVLLKLFLSQRVSEGSGGGLEECNLTNRRSYKCYQEMVENIRQALQNTTVK